MKNTNQIVTFKPSYLMTVVKSHLINVPFKIVIVVDDFNGEPLSYTHYTAKMVNNMGEIIDEHSSIMCTDEDLN
jgi:hypothetical protein